MSVGQRRVCVPIASGWSCVSREIYKVEQRKIPRYSRVSYHQKGTRTHLILKMTGKWTTMDTICRSFRPWRSCEGICWINAPANGHTDRFQPVILLTIIASQSGGLLSLVKGVFGGMPPTKPHHGS